jgi:hypothetical protein
MGWKDLKNLKSTAKLATEWAEARKTELLTADKRTREEADQRADAVERRAGQEAVTSFLEGVLPPSLAEKVTAARPENVAARRAEREAQEEVERRERLDDMSARGATGRLSLTISGGEHGSVAVSLPCEVEEEHPEPDEGPDESYDDGPPPLSWLRLRLESADPVPVGSTTLSALYLGVPAYAGAGRYDLVDLWAKGESGEIGWWEALDIFLTPHPEADDSAWFVDVTSGEPATIEVADRALRFDLPMVSAMSTIRASGSVSW